MKLTKDQENRRASLVETLRARSTKLDEVVDEYNAVAQVTWGAVEGAKVAYEESLGEARELAEEVATDAQNQIDERSEKWQEGDAGEAAIGWHGEWSEIDIPEELDLPKPDPVERPECGHADELESLPESSS